MYLPSRDLPSDRWDGAVLQRAGTALPWTTYAGVSATGPRPAKAAFRIADDPLFGLPCYWTFNAMLLQAILQDTAMLLQATYEQRPRQAPS